jgi:hypothetical protein
LIGDLPKGRNLPGERRKIIVRWLGLSGINNIDIRYFFKNGF